MIGQVEFGFISRVWSIASRQTLSESSPRSGDWI